MNSPGISGFGVIASCLTTEFRQARSIDIGSHRPYEPDRPSLPRPGAFVLVREDRRGASLGGVLAQLSTAPLEWGYGALSEPASDLVGQPGSGPECCRRRQHSGPEPGCPTRSLAG